MQKFKTLKYVVDNGEVYCHYSDEMDYCEESMKQDFTLRLWGLYTVLIWFSS